MANVALNIVVGGEEKAKQAIKELNGNIKQLGTNMKSLDEVFAGNQNSYDYLSAKLKNLTEAQEAYRKKTETLPDVIKFLRDQQNSLADNTDALKQKMEQATAAYDNAENKTAALKRAMNEATKEFNDNQKALNYARNAANDYQRQLTEAEGKVDVLGEEIRKTNGYLKEAAVSADGTATSIDRYGKEIKDAGEDTEEFADVAETIAKVLTASGLAKGVEELTRLIIDCGKASIEFESAFAGVEKTVDGTDEELKMLSDGIKELATEIPLTTTELAKIAETAGQLGIAKGDILTFTEVVANLAATTDLSAEEAAVSLARIANITGLMTNEYSNFGSTLVDLGNNSAAFESEILEMTNRLAGTGSIVEATNAQLLGIATTLVSLGIEAEAGGTAFSKLLTNIELAVETGSESVQKYADVAGMSVQEFSDAWRNDAVGAVAAFIDGLGDLDSQGQSAIVVLDEMGISEVRLRDTILKLTEADGLLTDNLKLSNTAWVENNALTEEAQKRYETTESKITLANTAINNLKITIGDELLKAFDGFIGKFTDLVTACDDFIKKNPDVVTGINTLKKALGINTELGEVSDATEDLVVSLQTLRKEYTETADAATKLSAFEETSRLYEKMSDAISDYDEKIAESRDNLANLREEQQKLLETQSATYAEEMKNAERAAALAQQIDAETKNIQAYISARNALGEQRRETAEDLAAWEAECAAAAEAIGAVGDESEKTGTAVSGAASAAAEAVGESAAAVEEAAAKSETASSKAATTAQNSQKAIDYIGDAIKQQAKDVKSSLDTLVKDYESAYSSVKSTLEGSAGMFEPLIFESDKTVQQMNEIWLSQADYFDGYLKNLERMVEVGFSEGVIAKFSDGSEASAGYAQKIVTDLNNIEAEYGKNSEQAKEFVQNTNESYGLLETNIDKLATFIAEQQTDFSARKDEILADAQTLLDNLAVYSGDSVEEVSKAVLEVVGEVESSLGSMAEAVEEKGGEAVEAAAEAREEVDEQFEGTEEVGREAGENYVVGMVEGIDENTPLVVEAGKRIADTLAQTVNSELGIQSPSKVGQQQGQFYDEGIALGIAKNTGAVVSGAVQMISNVAGASESAAKSAGQAIGSTMAAAAAQELGKAIREMAEKGELTYNGSTIGTAASAGIPNLSGQEAADWNAKLKAQYGLPSNWTNQDITDWLNGGGFMSGGSMPSVSSSGGSVTSSERTPNYLPKTTTQARTTLQKLMDEAVNSRVDGIVSDLVDTAMENGFDASGAGSSGIADQIASDVKNYFQSLIDEVEAQAKEAGETLSSADVYTRVMEQIDTAGLEEHMKYVGRTALAEYFAGAINAVDDGSGELNQHVGDAMQGVIDTTNDVLDINSPSKVGEQQGTYYVEGLALGVGEKEDELANRVTQLIEYMQEANEGVAKAAGSSLGTAVASAMSQALMEGVSKAIDSAQRAIENSGITDQVGKLGSSVNITQNFNTPVQSPYQTKVATEQGIKAVLY